MNSDILLFSIHFSSVLAFLPIAIMLWHLKKLKQRTFGWAILGYFSCLFLAGLFSYLLAYLVESTNPISHIFLIIQGFFVLQLFKNEYANKHFKTVSYVFFGVIIISEIFEFTFKGGFFSINKITYPIVNLTFILQFFLYLVDAIKNRPSIIYNRKSPFLILCTTLFYSINQLLFSLINEDIRMLLINNQYAMLIWALFVWFYIVYLLLSSYFLWRNLRS
jgi:hypothetical protein